MRTDRGKRGWSLNAVLSLNNVLPLAALLLVSSIWPSGVQAMEPEGKMFHTGLNGTRGGFSVSPDGNRLLFTTGYLSHGLRLLDLRSDKISVIPAASGRLLEMPSWSRDGGEVVAVSTAVRDNRYIVGDMQIVLLDPATWKHRTISAGEGVKIFPFFSADGKSIYYFKGAKRTGGKTPASRYDLFNIALATGQEQQLTNEQFYQVMRGDDDEKSGTVLFSAMGGARLDLLGRQAGGSYAPGFLVTFNPRTHELLPIPRWGGSPFQFRDPVRDSKGRLYFVAATLRDGGGNFRWFVFSSSPAGGAPTALAELSEANGFGLAWKTGEMFVMDRIGGEIVFRCLGVVTGWNKWE